MTCQSNGSTATITPVIPPSRKISRNPIAKSIGVVKRTTPFHIVAIHAKNCTPLGIVMMRLAAEKNDSASAGIPVANMWWTHTPKLMNADDHERGRHPDVAGEPLLREHRDDHRDHAGGGDEEDVHLGMAPEPEEVLVEQRAAAGADDVERRAEQPVQLEQRRPRPSPPAPRR